MLKRMSLPSPQEMQKHQQQQDRQLGSGSDSFFEATDKKSPLGGPGGHVYVTEGNDEVILSASTNIPDIYNIVS